MHGRVAVGVATALIAAVVSAGAGVGATSVDGRTARVPEANAVTPQSTAAPDDGSGIFFEAFRSYDLPFVPGESFYLQVRKGENIPVGPLHMVEVSGGTAIDLGAPNVSMGGTVNGVTTYLYDVVVPQPTEGEHTYEARFDATDTIAAVTRTLVIDVEPVPMTVVITSDPNPVQTHHAVTLYADVSGPGTGTAPTGTLTWRDDDTDSVVGTTSVADAALLLGSSLPVGVRHFVAEYEGDAEHAPATSAVFTLTVVADAVDATKVGVAYATFYPVKDGYRDSVAIKGVRAEPISVSIRVYSPTGSRVRTASITRATGPYSYAWNGRTTTGALLASGKYKVVQTLTDAASTKRTVTSYVNLSHKKLVTHTGYVTKKGSSLTAKGSAGTGRITISTTSGYSKLSAGSSGWALAGWEFTIPAATVYKSVAFQVYAKAAMSAPPTSIGLQSFTSCPRVSGTWYDTCFGRWAGIGNSGASAAWYSTSTISSAYRSGRYVRGMLTVDFGSAWVYKARAKVVYQTLE